MERTHRVDLYSAAEAGAAEDAWGYPTTGPFVAPAAAEDVECNLQPITGSVQQTAAGRQINASWRGFFPRETAIVEGMGVHVKQVLEDGSWVTPPPAHPTAFRVAFAGYEGGVWDTEVLLGRTAEAVPSA